MTKARRGIYAAAISPFNADGSLNTGKLIRYCQHLLGPGGCDGVAPTGTTGEGTSITMTDRLALPAAFSEAGIEKDRVIFGTGAPAAGDCVALTRAAMEAGYNSVLVLPPYYYKNVSDDGLYAYYANLVEKIGSDDLRIFLYHPRRPGPRGSFGYGESGAGDGREIPVDGRDENHRSLAQRRRRLAADGPAADPADRGAKDRPAR